MLKDKLSSALKKKNKEFDPMNLSLMDGFVDIKGYKTMPDGTKKMIYHDCGDNVVTDWMRHAIMVMLTGSNFSANGNDEFGGTPSAAASRSSTTSITMPNNRYHDKKRGENVSGKAGKNYDAYLLNGKQYFWNGGTSGVENDTASEMTDKYSQSTIKLNKYAYFPTKVLFGTGKEYSSWDVLQTENETANATWYTEMLNSYGGDVTTASYNFDTNIDLNCNTYSGSISKNIYTGNGLITKMRTVNDPDNSSNIITTTSTMNKNYGVVGAIKTPYFDGFNDKELLQSTLSDSGKLLKPINRGVGRPCFIYFNTPQENGATKEGWDQETTAEVALTKDSSSNYLNKITFTINMPSQDASSGAVGDYYPYNGYALKQIGLFNDARITTGITAENDANSYPYLNMPCGMLLAIKNITSIQKTADVNLVLTWTLTI